MGVTYTFLMIMMAIKNYKTRINDLIILSMTCFKIKGHFMVFSLKVVIFIWMSIGYKWVQVYTTNFLYKDQYLNLMASRELMGFFVLFLYVCSTIFQLCGTGLPGLNQY